MNTVMPKEWCSQETKLHWNSGTSGYGCGEKGDCQELPPIRLQETLCEKTGHHSRGVGEGTDSLKLPRKRTGEARLESHICLEDETEEVGQSEGKAVQLPEPRCGEQFEMEVAGRRRILFILFL